MDEAGYRFIYDVNVRDDGGTVFSRELNEGTEAVSDQIRYLDRVSRVHDDLSTGRIEAATSTNSGIGANVTIILFDRLYFDLTHLDFGDNRTIGATIGVTGALPALRRHPSQFPRLSPRLSPAMI